MNNDLPKICSNKNKLAIRFFDYAFKKLLEKNFYSVSVKNKHNFYLRDTKYANLFYGVHGCWWDGPLAYFVSRSLYDCDFYIMTKDLYRFTALSFAGAFSIEKNSYRGSLKAINHSIKILKNSKSSLWMFPQGDVMPQDYRPIVFQNGIAHICNNLEGVNLIPIACKYIFLRNEKPEIFVEIGKPLIVKNGISDKNKFVLFLQKEFVKLLDAQKAELAKGNYQEYERILSNKYTWLRMMEEQFKPLWRAKFLTKIY